MLSYEGTGKGIEKAIEDALLNLKAPREDCDIKILEEGGLFKKSRVLVTISADCQEKYQAKNKVETTEDVELDIKKLLTEEEKPEPVVEQKIEVLEADEPQLETPAQALEIKEEEPKAQRTPIDDINCVEFLKGLCEKLQIEAEIKCFMENEKIIVSLKGEKASELIGYRGDCLNSLQYLLNIIEQRKGGEKTRIILDIENYREKRESTLVSLAHRMARKVAKTRHQVKLEPMTPNERRIIHTALQNDNYVTTFSKGTEPNRYLIISPKQ